MPTAMQALSTQKDQLHVAAPRAAATLHWTQHACTCTLHPDKRGGVCRWCLGSWECICMAVLPPWPAASGMGLIVLDCITYLSSLTSSDVFAAGAWGGDSLPGPGRLGAHYAAYPGLPGRVTPGGGRPPPGHGEPGTPWSRVTSAVPCGATSLTYHRQLICRTRNLVAPGRHTVALAACLPVSRLVWHGAVKLRYSRQLCLQSTKPQLFEANTTTRLRITKSNNNGDQRAPDGPRSVWCSSPSAACTAAGGCRHGAEGV